MMLVKLGLAEGPSPETILAYDQVSQCALYVVSAIAPALAVALALVSSPFSLLLVLGLSPLAPQLPHYYYYFHLSH